MKSQLRYKRLVNATNGHSCLHASLLGFFLSSLFFLPAQRNSFLVLELNCYVAALVRPATVKDIKRCLKGKKNYDTKI